MEDVVLHYKSGPDQDVSSLIETTETLLAPFPCRPPQVFSPWFPSIVDRHLPLRPARPAPTILSADHPSTDQTRGRPGPEQDLSRTCASGVSPSAVSPSASRDLAHSVDKPKTPRPRRRSPETDRGVPFVPETPLDPDDPDPGLQVQTRPESEPESPSKRCWAVFSHRGQSRGQSRVRSKDQTRVQSSSWRLLQTVSKLQPQQRVKWVIDENNCRDIEQVWRSLSRPPLPPLPSSCNAHINRDRAQIWVYCDAVQAEQVGLSLKDELRLKGTISLWERSHGHVCSL